MPIAPAASSHAMLEPPSLARRTALEVSHGLRRAITIFLGAALQHGVIVQNRARGRLPRFSMICSSSNLQRFIVRLPYLDGLCTGAEFQGLRSPDHYPIRWSVKSSRFESHKASSEQRSRRLADAASGRPRQDGCHLDIFRQPVMAAQPSSGPCPRTLGRATIRLSASKTARGITH
jgi:hypothetical protein